MSLKVEHACHNRHRFGPKSENLDQLNLTFEEEVSIAEAEQVQTKPS